MFWPSPLFKNAYGVFIFFITFLTPLIISIFCYGRIVWILTRRIDSSLNGAKNDKFELARTNTIKMKMHAEYMTRFFILFLQNRCQLAL